ncbi:MAG: MAPEG family protein [Pseudomonadota bacterium]
MSLVITALYAGPLTLIILWMAFGVVALRRSEQVSLGDGGKELLLCRIRGHANAVETIPIGIVLLGLAEGLGTPGWILHILGLLLLIGRALHAVHFRQLRKGITLRFWGMLMTVLALALLSLGVFVQALMGLVSGSA